MKIFSSFSWKNYSWLQEFSRSYEFRSTSSINLNSTTNHLLKFLPRSWKKQPSASSSFSSSIYRHPRKRIRHVYCVCGFSTWDLRRRRRHLHSTNSNCVSSSSFSIYGHVSHLRTTNWIRSQLYAASSPAEIRLQIRPPTRNPMIWLDSVLFHVPTKA